MMKMGVSAGANPGIEPGKKSPRKPVRFRIATCTNQNRTVNVIYFFTTRSRASQHQVDDDLHPYFAG